MFRGATSFDKNNSIKLSMNGEKDEYREYGLYNGGDY